MEEVSINAGETFFLTGLKGWSSSLGSGDGVGCFPKVLMGLTGSADW